MPLTPSTITNKQAALQALQWYIDHGIDDVLADEPVNHFEEKPFVAPLPMPHAEAIRPQQEAALSSQPPQAGGAPVMMGVKAQAEALKLANEAQTLEALKAAIQNFDGLEIKQTATQQVFADGNPQADLMVLIDTPGDEDDRQGRPLSGADGALFDKALACIGRARMGDSGQNSLYIAPIVNWRTPGNRSLTQSEIATALPFIERHIALVRPKALLICGAVAAKAVLGAKEGISRLRKKQHSYSVQTAGLDSALADVPCIASYPPAYLVSTPLQKRAFWHDLLKLKDVLATLEGTEKGHGSQE